MPTIPVRGVGEVGVVSDLNPQDAPISAWSDARNVRFAEGIMSRYSVFRKASTGYTYTKTPVGVVNGWSNGEGYLLTVFSDGSIEELHNDSVTTINTASAGVSNEQITTTVLGGITYINRSNDTPKYRERPGSGAFASLPGWNSYDRCYSLRAFKDFLIALNVSKSGVDYPGMVKWSDATQAGAPPQSWSLTDPASLAGENILNDLEGRLIDGLALGDCFMVYGEHQSYRMDYIGAPYIFSFTKVFSDQGVMARNCIVEVQGRHYVFGRSEIYVTDGITRQSIAADKVQKQIYSELDFEQMQRCFCYHDKVHGEIAFCYPSVSDDAHWSMSDIAGCNKAAVFNYRFNTWTFVDLPSLVGSCEASLVSSSDWSDFTTWTEASQTWASFAGQRPRGLIVCGSGNPAITKKGRAYILDDMLRGIYPMPVDTDVIWPAYAEALHKDMDEIGADLLGRKLITRITPQFRLGDVDMELSLKVGQAPIPIGEVKWGSSKKFTGYSSDRYDARMNGRYLSMRIDIPAMSYVDFSGYDLTVQIIAGR